MKRDVRGCETDIEKRDTKRMERNRRGSEVHVEKCDTEKRWYKGKNKRHSGKRREMGGMKGDVKCMPGSMIQGVNEKDVWKNMEKWKERDGVEEMAGEDEKKP